VVITRFGHTYNPSDLYVKGLAKLIRHQGNPSFTFSLPTLMHYKSRLSLFGYLRNWSDSDRRDVIRDRYEWSKRVLIRDEIIKRFTEAGLKNVRTVI
jgi:hypothetical protein